MNDNKTRAERHADECAAEMARKLEYFTPADMGWPHLTAEQLIASERKCWLEEEQRFDYEC